MDKQISLVSALLCFCLFQSAAIGGERKHSDCWSKACRIQADVSKIHPKLQKRFNPTRCPAGIPLSKIPVPEGTLKDPQHQAAHAIVGRTNKSLIIPLIEDPESFLLPGDILIYTKAPGQMSLMDHALEGMGHASVVVRRQGRLFHIDSPRYLSSDDFGSDPYHVLRYSLYPPQVQSAQDLERWQKDPKLKVQLDQWTDRREKVLQLVEDYSFLLMRHGWKYDPQFSTELLNPATLGAWRADFLKECTKKTPELYCSELPLLLYGTAGEPLIKAQSLFRTIHHLEEETIPKQMKEKNMTREQVIEREIQEQFQNHPAIQRMTGMERARLKAALESYLSTTPSERDKLLKGLQMMGMGIQIPTTPADFFNAIYDEDGYLAYAGTFVGRDCQAANDVRPSSKDGVPAETAAQLSKMSKEVSTAVQDLAMQLDETQTAKIEALEDELFRLQDSYFVARAKLSQQLQTESRQPASVQLTNPAIRWEELADTQKKALDAFMTKLKARLK